MFPTLSTQSCSCTWLCTMSGYNMVHSYSCQIEHYWFTHSYAHYSTYSKATLITPSGKNVYPRLVNVYYIVSLLLVNLRIHIMNSRNVLHMLITVILFIPVFTWTNLFLPTAVHNTYSTVLMAVIHSDSQNCHRYRNHERWIHFHRETPIWFQKQ